MHVSPYHKKRNWQIMITGIWIGAIIGYIILIFMYGRMYEQTLTDQVRMQTEISELERQNKALLEDKEDLEEKSSPDVLSVSIEFMNSEKLHLDKLITHQLEDLIKHELDLVIGKNVESIMENDQLVIDRIEDKTYTIDDLSYKIDVKKISITKTIKLSLIVKPYD